MQTLFLSQTNAHKKMHDTAFLYRAFEHTLIHRDVCWRTEHMYTEMRVCIEAYTQMHVCIEAYTEMHVCIEA